jgi:hypothetical protein
MAGSTIEKPLVFPGAFAWVEFESADACAAAKPLSASITNKASTKVLIITIFSSLHAESGLKRVQA